MDKDLIEDLDSYSSSFKLLKSHLEDVGKNSGNLERKKISVDSAKGVFNGERMKGKLEDFQGLLDIQFPESRYAKMHMSVLWEAGDLTDLQQFLLRDVKITWKLYENMEVAGLC